MQTADATCTDSSLRGTQDPEYQTCVCTFGAVLLLDGRPDSGLGVMREPQPPDLIEALEQKGGLQVSPGNARRPPLIRPTTNVVALLPATRARSAP